MDNLDDYSYKNATIGMIFGVVIVGVAVYGIVAVVLGGYVLLIIYTVVLIGVTIGMIVFEVLIILEVGNESGSAFSTLMGDINNFVPYELDSVQKNFQCCGIEKYTDYFRIWRAWGDITGNESLAKQWRFLSSIQKEVYSNDIFNTVRRPRRDNEKRLSEPVDATRATAEESATTHHSLNKSKSSTLHPSIANIPGNRERLTKRMFSALLPSSEMVDGYSGIVNAFLDEVFPKIEYKLKIFGRKAWSEKNYYQEQFPEAFKNWVSALVGYMHVWERWKEDPANVSLRWWYGSGWDLFLFSHFSDGGLPVLPKTCCKYPKAPCHGLSSDTYTDGCREKLKWYWKTCNIQLGLIFACYLAGVVCNCISLYLLLGTLKNKFF